MLQCTKAAASTIRQLRERQGIPETYGLRVFPARTPSGEVSLALDFAEAPDDGDQVNERHGQKLFVAPEVAEELSDLALDAVADPTSDGAERVRLTLVRSPEST